MKTIVFFNNKGGVGKTTLCSNIAAHFAQTGYRTLLVDCDPQCNSTLLVLGDTYFETALRDPQAPLGTILQVVQPINDGEPEPDPSIRPMKSSTNRFKVSIIAGHPRLSLIEDHLSSAWSSLNSGEVGGFRTSNWFHRLVTVLQNRYDVAFVDVGPSLGSLNRSILIGADYFVTPMGCDIFSLMGVRNISDWLGEWLLLYKNGLSLCRKRFGKRLSEFQIVRTPGISRGFAGYTVQQYITKAKQGVRRATGAYENILEEIEPEIHRYLSSYFVSSRRRPFVSKLGDVPNMYSLIPLAQSVHSPINALESKDGLVGSQFKQAETYGNIIDDVARSLAHNVGLRK